jgi:AraC-type DNA-binding domain-containing proteins
VKSPQPEITIISIAHLVAISVGIFLSLILFFSWKGNAKANKYLAFLIFSFSVLQIWDFLIQTHMIFKFPYMIKVVNPLLFVLGPLVFFYVKALTSIDWTFKRMHLVHFIPVVVSYILFIPVYILNTQEKVRLITEAFLNGRFIISPVFYALAVIHILAYLVLSIRKLLAHTITIKNNYSFIERLSLTWLRNMLIIFIVLWFAFATRVFFRSVWVWDISAFLSLLTVYIIGYFGYNQPVIFKKITNENLSDVNREGKRKYATSPLTDRESAGYVKKLQTLMDSEKLYLQNDLKLSDVSEKMNLPVYYVSQVINEKLDKNFYDFINEYRVEEVKKRLMKKEYDHFTILAAGFDSGFNSKTAFYTAFKRITGVTPLEFKNRVIKY